MERELGRAATERWPRSARARTRSSSLRSRLMIRPWPAWQRQGHRGLRPDMQAWSTTGSAPASPAADRVPRGRSRACSHRRRRHLGHATLRLGVYALTAIAPLAPGAPLCRAHPTTRRMFAQIALKVRTRSVPPTSSAPSTRRCLSHLNSRKGMENRDDKVALLGAGGKTGVRLATNLRARASRSTMSRSRQRGASAELTSQSTVSTRTRHRPG